MMNVDDYVCCDANRRSFYTKKTSERAGPGKRWGHFGASHGSFEFNELVAFGDVLRVFSPVTLVPSVYCCRLSDSFQSSARALPKRRLGCQLDTHADSALPCVLKVQLERRLRFHTCVGSCCATRRKRDCVCQHHLPRFSCV